uniref:Glutathione S-transferase n=1 Tax=Panagrolaimus sp. ES5 TaxID=591445 RepID=A0AC34FAJ1_9BILA
MPNFLETKNGKLPYLEYDGHTITESYAIDRFLARKYNLAGKDELEAALIDSIADIQKDFYNSVLPWLRVFRGYIKGNPDDLKKEHVDEPIKTYFPYFSNYLKESKSGFMAPSGLSWVDFVITEFFTTLIQIEPKTLDKYPDLKEYLKRVHQVPQLKEYYSQRPDVY